MDLENLVVDLENVREDFRLNIQRQLECGKRISGRAGQINGADENDLSASIVYGDYLRKREQELRAKIAGPK